MVVQLLFACVGLDTLPEKPGSNQDSGTGSGPVTVGGLQLSAAAVDFGEVELDHSATELLTVTNTGGDPVEVLGELSGSTRFSVDSSLFSLDAGAEQVLSLSFTPDMETEFSGELVLTSDAGDIANVPLSGVGAVGGAGTDTDPTGTGSAPDIAASDTSASFGSVDVGDSLSRTLSIRNDGDADLHLDPASTTDSAFSVVGDFAGSVTLAAGTSRSLQVDFSPSAARSYSARLELESDDPDEPTLSIDLDGTGVESCSICAPLIDVDTGGDPYSIEDFFVLVGLWDDTRTIQVHNDGDEDLVISSVGVNNDFISPCGSFSLSGWSSSETVSPGGSTSFEVSYSAVDTCIDLAQGSIDMNVLHIMSNDPGEPDYIISLGGTAL